MCGISGYASGILSNDNFDLERANDLLKHRGPDGSGTWRNESGTVGLAHRRLAVIDLTPAGSQPMQLVSDSLVIVFNGEIYNHNELRAELMLDGHTFSSSSDTEVLLAGYSRFGLDFFKSLVGMYAIAIFDQKKNKILLCRDRLGEKPLYYHYSDSSFQFSSELKALIKPGETFNHQAIECLLSFCFVPGEHTTLERFRMLPPAHYAQYDIDSGQLSLHRYWTLDYAKKNFKTKKAADLADTLEVLLDEAVGRQLQADVPVGVLLSGGVDSSLVTAAAVKHRPDLRTYSVTFPGFGHYDESLYSKLVADHFGTNHVELIADKVGPEIVKELAIQCDDPIVDSSIIPTYLLSKKVREHCTVALGGDGADELFGGYTNYSRRYKIERLIGWLPIQLRAITAWVLENTLDDTNRVRNWAPALVNENYEGLALVSPLFNASLRGKLLSDLSRSNLKIGAEDIWKSRVPNADNLVRRATLMDLENYLPDDILVKVDRASMLASLEIRSPFLDHKVVEFAFNEVPDSLKVSWRQKKILPKILARKVLPPSFDFQRKQGFSIPLDQWLCRGEWREYFEQVLLCGKSVFDSKVIKQLFLELDHGALHGERLFALVMIEIWRRHYDINISH